MRAVRWIVGLSLTLLGLAIVGFQLLTMVAAYEQAVAYPTADAVVLVAGVLLTAVGLALLLLRRGRT